VQIIPPHLAISLPVDAIEDHGPSTPTMEDLRPPTAVSWTEWLRPPPSSVCRLAQSLVGGLAWPIDVTSLLGEAWVGDFVFCATVLLLAPCCRLGVHLFPPMLPGESLDGADRSGLWAATLSSSSAILLPILCSGHWFLLRMLPQLRRGVVYNSIPGHGDGAFISTFPEIMRGITGDSWEVVSGPSPRQSDGHNCALFVLLSIFRWGLGPRSAPLALGEGWPGHFRTHWLAFLASAGVRARPGLLPEPD
jgi:hypothetical protein